MKYITKETISKFLMILISFLIIEVPYAKADSIATQQFTIDSDTTMDVATSGTLNSSINGLTGIMNGGLNINFAITSNQPTSDIYLKATVKDVGSNTYSAFHSSGTALTTTQPIHLLFTEVNSPKVTSASIHDCKQDSSIALNNPAAIAYSGNVSIDNNGTIQYQTNGGEGYFSANVPSGTTNLAITLSTNPKLGTYDISLANDPSGTYEATIYLDNIP